MRSPIIFQDEPRAPEGAIFVGKNFSHPYWNDERFAFMWIIWRAQGMLGPEPKPFPATTPSTKTSENKKPMPLNTPPSAASEGEAILVNHGFTVINATNGKLELHQGVTIIGGLSSGNLRDMLAAQKALELEFAKKSELTTDASSPDDQQ